MQGQADSTFWHMFTHFCAITDQRVEKEKEMNTFLFVATAQWSLLPIYPPVSKMRSQHLIGNLYCISIEGQIERNYIYFWDVHAKYIINVLIIIIPNVVTIIYDHY